jgi:hypothetical protein
MNDIESAGLFLSLDTRTEVRDRLAAQIVAMTSGSSGGAELMRELGTMATGNDRQLMQSWLVVKSRFGAGRRGERRSESARIGGAIHALFASAIERMKQLPPEPAESAPLEIARRVKRL